MTRSFLSWTGLHQSCVTKSDSALWGPRPSPRSARETEPASPRWPWTPAWTLAKNGVLLSKVIAMSGHVHAERNFPWADQRPMLRPWGDAHPSRTKSGCHSGLEKRGGSPRGLHSLERNENETGTFTQFKNEYFSQVSDHLFVSKNWAFRRWAFTTGRLLMARVTVNSPLRRSPPPPGLMAL